MLGGFGGYCFSQRVQVPNILLVPKTILRIVSGAETPNLGDVDRLKKDRLPQVLECSGVGLVDATPGIQCPAELS